MRRLESDKIEKSNWFDELIPMSRIKIEATGELIRTSPPLSAMRDSLRDDSGSEAAAALRSSWSNNSVRK